MAEFNITIDKKDKIYSLKVNNEGVFESDKLSDIVRKIEAYLKLRYLPEPVKLTLFERISGAVSNGRA